jgi:tetratricopeptide (TPR) repeat protein
MNCKQAEKLLVEYLYQELPAKKTVEMEKHLQVCDQCTKTLENWQAIHRGYQKSTSDAAAPPYLKQRILVAAREELEKKPTVWEQITTFLKPAIVAPVIVFALLALLVTSTQKKSSIDVNMAQERDRLGGVEAPQPTTPTGSRQISNAPLRENSNEKRASKTKGLADDEKERVQVGGKLDGRKDVPSDYGEVAQGGAKKQADEVSSLEELRSEPEKPSEVKSEMTENKLKEGQLNKELNARQPEAPAAAAPPAVEKQEAAPKVTTASADADTSFQQAQYWFKNNQLNQGKAVADQAISKDKSKTLASQFHQAGITYQQNKEPQQAIVQFNLVLNNYPDYSNSPDVLLRLGDTYAQIGQYENAIKAFRQLARFEGMKKIAAERIYNLQNQQKNLEQLKALGYVQK